MKREISEAARPGRKVDLWTPWGILRLTDPEDAARQERKPRRHTPTRPAGDASARERNAGTRA